MIIEMHLLLLVKDYIMSCYNHHVQVIIAIALNFKMAALHFVKYLWGIDKSNSIKWNYEEHKRLAEHFIKQRDEVFADWLQKAS